MGTSHSVELFPDQDSEIEPGQKSIISASLDDLDPAVSAEQFLSELAENLKRPYDAQTEAVVKTCDVTENAPDDFTVKVVLDGKKLDSFGFGRGDGCDRVRTWKRVVIDRAAGKVVTTDYVIEAAFGAWADEATDTQSQGGLTLQVLKNPTRLEMYACGADGTRYSGEGMANLIYIITDSVIGEIQDAARHKVKAAPGPAIKNAGETSVVTGPMEEFVDYDGFFSKMTQVLQESFGKIPGAEVEASDTEIVARIKVADADGSEKLQTHTVTHSAESGEMTIVRRDNEGNVVNTSYRVVHRSPLVVEAWNITRDGERVAGAVFAKVLQKQVNEVIERANSWFG